MVFIRLDETRSRHLAQDGLRGKKVRAVARAC